MPFFYDLDPVPCRCEQEHCYDVLIDELDGNGTASNSRKFLGTGTNILPGLYNRNLIVPALCLDRYHIVTAMFVDADIELIYLDLSNFFDRGTQVALKRVRGYSEEYIQQPIVPNDREKCLFIVQSIASDQFWGGVGNSYFE